VLPGSTTVDVTIKLPGDFCRKARHRAVDESKSLSAWVAGLNNFRTVLAAPGKHFQ